MSDSPSHPLWVVRMVIDTALRDVEGRLLRENRAPAEAIRPGEIEMKGCPYAGSRQTTPPLPMNVSALRATTNHWDDVVNSVALMRVAYEQVRGISTMDLFDVWRVSQLGSALPWYYVLGHGELAPAYASNLAKATLGMGLWGQTVFVKSVAEQWKVPTLTSREILALAEANGTLIAETEVCSAPEKMLLRFYDALLDLEPETTSPQMQRLMDNRDGVIRFGAHYTNMKVAMYVLFLARRFLYADLLAALPESDVAPKLRELLDAECEPPDMVMVGPVDMVGTPLAKRCAWIASLVMNIVPIAPDRSDVPLQVTMVEAAATMLLADGPPELIDEIVETQHCTPEQASLAARAIATWARLDHLFARAVGIVENGLRGAVGADLYDAVIRAEDRDRLVVVSGRGVVSTLAPRAVSSLCPS